MNVDFHFTYSVFLWNKLAVWYVTMFYGTSSQFGMWRCFMEQARSLVCDDVLSLAHKIRVIWMSIEDRIFSNFFRKRKNFKTNRNQAKLEKLYCKSKPPPLIFEVSCYFFPSRSDLQKHIANDLETEHNITGLRKTRAVINHVIITVQKFQWSDWSNGVH